MTTTENNTAARGTMAGSGGERSKEAVDGAQPTQSHRDDVPGWKQGALLLSFAITMAMLAPLYLANRAVFNRRKRTRPMASSPLVDAQTRWPILYEIAMLFQNFPMYDAVYRRIEVRPGKVLQVGCGTGLFNRYLRRTCGKILYNVELNAPSVTLAKRLGRVDDAVCASITERLPFADGEFEQIIFARSLHHIHRHKQAFRECLRILAPDGEIVVFDPVIVEGEARQPEAWMGNSSIDGLIWRYTASSLARLIARNLPDELVVARIETDRMPHLTNFNLVVPQTDAIITIRRKPVAPDQPDQPST